MKKLKELAAANKPCARTGIRHFVVHGISGDFPLSSRGVLHLRATRRSQFSRWT
ncbi:MAG: hypothetical protein WAO19_13215 [Candidatus Kryptoniota bacterium]